MSIIHAVQHYFESASSFGHFFGISNTDFKRSLTIIGEYMLQIFTVIAESLNMTQNDGCFMDHLA